MHREVALSFSMLQGLCIDAVMQLSEKCHIKHGVALPLPAANTFKVGAGYGGPRWWGNAFWLVRVGQLSLGSQLLLLLRGVHFTAGADSLHFQSFQDSKKLEALHH